MARCEEGSIEMTAVTSSVGVISECDNYTC